MKMLNGKKIITKKSRCAFNALWGGVEESP